MVKLEELFQRRLLVVVGKGGVGKTTVACGLGLAAAHLGKRVLIAEVDGMGRAATLLGIEPGAIGEARPVRNHLSVMSVEGSAALMEYLQIIVPIKRVLQLVFASRIYHYFVAAAPGLKELMTIGKIWYEAERIDEDTGEPLWDLVVLDAPATGHSLQYLGMPRAAHSVFRAGLVGNESQRLMDLLSDPERCAVNLVTTAEEMPVNETLEMYERLRGELAMPLGWLFVNRVHHVEWTGADLAEVERVAAETRVKSERDLLQETISRAREEQGWAAINAEYLNRLRGSIAMPLIEIPYEFAEEFGAAEVQRIAAVMRAAQPQGS
ncbi:MAG TPA: ArsA-related P-loop ATPase [Terriglobales bacterium]|nr:ArsA-related P-loop ATPase [Terriglobales bacterium]